VDREKESIHQGIMDHLAEAGFSNKDMDVAVKSVQVDGDKADATVEVSLKGAGQGHGMQMRYGLEHKGSKWVVVTRADGSGHGAAAAPGAPNPHGGGAMDSMPDMSGDQKMPSLDDLPPVTKKKQ
jgi:hypothetical protein